MSNIVAETEATDVVEVAREEESAVVELSLVDLQYIGGGAGNAAIDF